MLPETNPRLSQTDETAMGRALAGCLEHLSGLPPHHKSKDRSVYSTSGRKTFYKVSAQKYLTYPKNWHSQVEDLVFK